MEATMDDQTGSKIVGTQGDFLFLIERADGRGQVANTAKCRLFAPRAMDSFLARGDWKPCAVVDIADVLAQVTVRARLRKLVGMIAWALVDRRFEPDDDHRIPVRRALAFAWGDANILGDLGVKTSECGCEWRFGRPLVFCWLHGVEGD